MPLFHEIEEDIRYYADGWTPPTDDNSGTRVIADTLADMWIFAHLSEEESIELLNIMVDEYLEEGSMYGDGDIWDFWVRYPDYEYHRGKYAFDLMLDRLVENMDLNNAYEALHMAGIAEEDIDQILVADQQYVYDANGNVTTIEDMDLHEYLQFLEVEEYKPIGGAEFNVFSVINRDSPQGELIVQKALEHYIDNNVFYEDMTDLAIPGFDNFTAGGILEYYLGSSNVQNPQVLTHLAHSLGLEYYYVGLYAQHSDGVMLDRYGDGDTELFLPEDYITELTVIELTTAYHQMYMWQKHYEFNRKSEELQDLYSDMEFWSDVASEITAFQKQDSNGWMLREHYNGGEYKDFTGSNRFLTDGGIVYTNQDEEETAWLSSVVSARGYDSWYEFGEMLSTGTYDELSEFADLFNSWRGTDYSPSEVEDWVLERYAFPSEKVHEFLVYARTDEGIADMNFDQVFNSDNDYTYGVDDIDGIVTAVNNKYATLENEANIITIDLNEILTRYNEAIQYLSSVLDKIFQTIDGINNRI